MFETIFTILLLEILVFSLVVGVRMAIDHYFRAKREHTRWTTGYVDLEVRYYLRQCTASIVDFIANPVTQQVLKGLAPKEAATLEQLIELAKNITQERKSSSS